MGKRILIVGATGMVGGEALKLALQDPRVAQVLTLGRRATGIQHDKLVELLAPDFGDLSGLAGQLENVDGCLFCLGVYTGQVDDDLFRKITVDYAVNTALALQADSPQAVFCLLSGQGADRTEASRMSFARYKGVVENKLADMGLGGFSSFRPGYIHPVVAREEPNFTYRVSRAVWPVLGKLFPKMGIDSDRLARAMLDGALNGDLPEVLENTDILARVA